MDITIRLVTLLIVFIYTGKADEDEPENTVLNSKEQELQTEPVPEAATQQTDDIKAEPTENPLGDPPENPNAQSDSPPVESPQFQDNIPLTEGPQHQEQGNQPQQERPSDNQHLQDQSQEPTGTPGFEELPPDAYRTNMHTNSVFPRNRPPQPQFNNYYQYGAQFQHQQPPPGQYGSSYPSGNPYMPPPHPGARPPPIPPIGARGSHHLFSGFNAYGDPVPRGPPYPFNGPMYGYGGPPPPGGQPLYEGQPPYGGPPPHGGQFPYGGPPPPGGQSPYGGPPHPGNQPPYGGHPQYNGPPPPRNQPQYNGPPPPGNQPQYNGPPPPGNQPQYNGPPPPGNQPQYNGPPPHGGQHQYNGPPPPDGQPPTDQPGPTGYQQNNSPDNNNDQDPNAVKDKFHQPPQPEPMQTDYHNQYPYTPGQQNQPDVDYPRDNKALDGPQFAPYDRERIIEIQDLPEFPDENIPEIIGRLSDVLRVPIEQADVVAVYRTRGKFGKTKPLMVEFIDKEIRNDVLHAARKVHLNTKFFYADLEEKPVYINEPLTRFFRKLLYETKKRASEMGYKFCWYRNSRLHVKKDEFSDTIDINTFADIEKLV